MIRAPGLLLLGLLLASALPAGADAQTEPGSALPVGTVAARRTAIDKCPSSDDLRRFAVLRNGGSGPPWLRG
ncbi:hypothetical protein MTDSW087_04896 [Methylobacterium dankookense]|uniref:Uncharacterized protein n=1 Tax=Methylobacterium dankookense TaxID=560405 RepID=A0A564G6J2_9HYPH|nr:hypothetical protein MTDSW087_04896 [Methylobacterium dankookense]